MSGQLPKLSGRAVVRAFSRDGWQIARQKGGHIILVKEGSWATPPYRIIAKSHRVGYAA